MATFSIIINSFFSKWTLNTASVVLTASFFKKKSRTKDEFLKYAKLLKFVHSEDVSNEKEKNIIFSFLCLLI